MSPRARWEQIQNVVVPPPPGSGSEVTVGANATADAPIVNVQANAFLVVSCYRPVGVRIAFQEHGDGLSVAVYLNVGTWRLWLTSPLLRAQLVNPDPQLVAPVSVWVEAIAATDC